MTIENRIVSTALSNRKDRSRKRELAVMREWPTYQWHTTVCVNTGSHARVHSRCSVSIFFVGGTAQHRSGSKFKSSVMFRYRFDSDVPSGSMLARWTLTRVFNLENRKIKIGTTSGRSCSHGLFHFALTTLSIRYLAQLFRVRAA